MEGSSEWIEAVIRRLASALPHHSHNQLCTPANKQLLTQTVDCVVTLSQGEFPAVISCLSTLLQDLIKSHPPASAREKEVESFCTVLNCLERCLAKRIDGSLANTDLHCLQALYQRITLLSLLPKDGENTDKIAQAANVVLYYLSGHHFHGIFNKIILKVTSWNCVHPNQLGGGVGGALSTPPESPETDQLHVIGLIPHLNLDAARLQQILQVIVTSFRDLRKHKTRFVSIPPILHTSIWNFIEGYPHQFNDLLRNGYPSLERSADKLFNLCAEFATDSNKKKIQIMPLQNTVLILCPTVLKDITEGGIDKVNSKHKSQRNFLNAVIKGLSSTSKQLCESSTVCAVDIFKAGSFVADRSSSFFRYFVTQVQGQLHNLLFSPQNLFLHQPSSIQASIPTFTDKDHMVTCLIAQFRTNHRNSHIFQVCLDSNSPTVFRLAFVEALQTVLKKENSVSWWPSNEAVYMYAPNLREIFENILPLLRRYDITATSLNSDVKLYFSNTQAAANMLQGKSKNEKKTLVEIITNFQLMKGLIKLFQMDPMLAFSSLREGDRLAECRQFMTGLVTLIQHTSIPNLPLNASEVLLSLHHPNNIDLWDPEDPMTAFWDISGQVTLSIALKLFIRKTVNPIQLLEWLKQILCFRTQFLKQLEHIEVSQLNSCKVLHQMYTMLETVLLLFLRNTNVNAVRLAMSCFKYLVLEAELVMAPTEPSMIPYAANLMSYKQLDELSQLPPIGRAQQQKKIRSILKGLIHTPGSALAWEDTYSSWRVTKSVLITYVRPKDDTLPVDAALRLSESFSRNIMRRVNTAVTPGQGGSGKQQEQQLNEDTIQEEILTWSNMTGFLCSLAGVSTKPSPSTYSLLFMTSGSGAAGAGAGGFGMIDGEVPPQPSTPTCGISPSTSVGVMPGSPIRDPIHVRVKRSSSYHGGRPKSITHTPPSRISTAIGQHAEAALNMSRGAGSSDGTIPEEDKPTRTSQTESFVSELMNLLRCDNEALGIQIRETVKELVSYELSPAVYPYLFECMMTEARKVFGTDGKALISESNTALIDQLVSIVQHILETKVEGALEHLIHVKIDEIVSNLVVYVHSLESSERSLTIRIKVCHLIETVMQRVSDVSFRAEVQFRNEVAAYLTQWIRGKICTEESKHIDTLHSDLDLSALRAIGLIMSGLVLQSKYKSSDITEGKSKLFLRYFSSFMNLIDSLNKVDWTKLSTLQKQPLMRHVSSMREYTIQAVSNMLTANIDSGLIHAIGLGYNEDLKTRTSFIEVLTSILQQGAEFNSLADTALADRYNLMLDLVTQETADGEFPIMIALVNSITPDYLEELAEALVLLFDYKNKLSPFLTRILSTEVEILESGPVDTLFRGNTIACKVLSLSFKTFGLYYLQSVVRPLIIQLMKGDNRDYEVDPARLSDPNKLQRNQLNLLDLVQKFFTTILNSLPSLPLQLRTVCHILFAVVSNHFPDSAVDTVNSTIFLRFINPAIVSPQSYNLVQTDIPPGTRRGLTFISKVLQNLANHVLFKKEAHMEVFNEFLRDNFALSRQLAICMSSTGPYLEGEAVEYITFIKETHKHRLHSLLWSNHERINTFAASTRTYVVARPLFQELNTLLAYIGAPNYRKKHTMTTNPRNTLIGSQLEEFLDSMANECDEKTLRAIKAKEIFYQSGVSRAGNPIFYFIARKFRGDQQHTSYQVLYHVMTLLKNCSEKAFELVIDLTQSSSVNEPELELMVKFAAYVPELAMSSIEAIYFYNINMAFKQYAGRLGSTIRIFSHIKGSKRAVMIDSINRFSEFIDPMELNLPSTTMALLEGGVEFDVHFLMFKQVALQIPATLLVCGCGIVISMVDPIKVFEIPTILKDVYHISDIREVFIEDKGSLTVRLVDEGHVLKFTSPGAEKIMKEINDVISRWQNEQPSRFMSERKLGPKDVPGTFLNLALLNLGSTDSALRIAAYKLLSAVKDAFQLRIDLHLESTHDLCVPTNSAQFVLMVTEELAKNETHLTLEFLSEVVAGFQQHSPAMKQLCLAYMSPWLPNLSKFSGRSEGSCEHEKVTKLIDLLVALTISEEEMYPLIQTHVWAKISREKELLRRVLATFIRMGIIEGLGSRKVEVLADTVVTLEHRTEGLVATEIIKKLLKTVAHTSDPDHVTNVLDKHYLWAELTVLARFLLALSFNNKVNVLKNIADVFYLCVVMMSYGPIFTRATIHGIITNTVQSLGSLSEVMANEEASKKVSLKLVEFSDPKLFMQFGIPNPPSVTAYIQSHAHTTTRHHSFSEMPKDTLGAQAVISVTEHLYDLLSTCEELFEDCKWTKRWQRLARRTSFFYNPALQSRSFLMLGVISRCGDSSNLLITKTLRVLEETMARHENDVVLIEAIIICLTRLVPLLDENTKLNQHLFWVAVGILQLNKTTLYAAGLCLMEACIKVLTNIEAFEEQDLAKIMQPTRDAMEFPLNEMDREIGISFSSDFHFALAMLLYKGFSHPLSTVRTRTQELLTTIFFLHSRDGCLGTMIEVNNENLAYLTALFPESEIIRDQLKTRRTRLKSFAVGLNESSLLTSDKCETTRYGSLLSVHAIPTPKQQILFLLTLASALINTQDDKKIKLLYEFLADACDVYSEVFPLIHLTLVEHLQQTLQSSQSKPILKAVQKLITVAVERSDSSVLIKPTFIEDIGFSGVLSFFGLFPKQTAPCPTTRGSLFHKYLVCLLAEISPSTSSPEHLHHQQQRHFRNKSSGSIGKLSSCSSISSGSMKDYVPISTPTASSDLIRKGVSTGNITSGGLTMAASNYSLGENVGFVSSITRSPERGLCILGRDDTLSMDELDILDAEETVEETKM